MDPNLRLLSNMPRHDWEMESVAWYYDVLTDRVAKAIPDLAAMNLHPWGELAQDVLKLYGNIDSPNHAFSVDTFDWGGTLTEWQVTKALTSHIDPASGSDGKNLCVLFLKTLFELSGDALFDISELRELNIQVATEHTCYWRRKNGRNAHSALP